jgi:EAL domain-containing protein (putative c-di-GMP-specific phosphodiesterase class I)
VRPNGPHPAFTEARTSGCFAMAFQPIVDLGANRIIAYEALVRGNNGESAREVLSRPGNGNRYAFDQACRHKAVSLASKLGLNCGLHINFLPNSVYEAQSSIAHTVEAAVQFGFPPDRLTFEILECECIRDPYYLRQVIQDHRHHGFNIALDDFGTAFANLSRLINLEPDIIKIDRTFIAGCEHHAAKRAVLAAMIGMGRDLNVKVIFEGIETIAEVETLYALGARLMQGFYFARPTVAMLSGEQDIVWP